MRWAAVPALGSIGTLLERAYCGSEQNSHLRDCFTAAKLETTRAKQDLGYFTGKHSIYRTTLATEVPQVCFSVCMYFAWPVSVIWYSLCVCCGPIDTQQLDVR